MENYEAIKRCCGKFIAEIAKRLGLKPVTVYKWTEPSEDFTDSGALNPVDRLEIMMEASMSLGNSFEDATAPLQRLNSRFGIIGITLPKNISSNGELSQELLSTIQEFGHLAEEASKAFADGKLTPKEYRRIEKEGWDLIRQVTAFMHKAKESAR
ncbi:MAG: phage regulatory CII family protein [Nitrospirota bacterium]